MNIPITGIENLNIKTTIMLIVHGTNKNNIANGRINTTMTNNLNKACT